MAVTTEKESLNGAEKITSEKFPLKDRNIHLSLEVRDSLLLAAVLDKRTNQYLAWASFPFTEKELIEGKLWNDEWFAIHPTDVSVVFTANSSVLVPTLYYKKDSVNDYLEGQQLTKPQETANADYIKSLDCYNLYTVGRQLDAIRSKWPNAVFRHHSSVFLEYVLVENKNSANEQVHAYVFNKFVDVAVIKAGKLILSNRFYFENSSDFIYHLLWVYEQLGLSAEKTPCIFYGEIEKLSDTYKIAVTYMKQIRLADRNEQLSYAIPLNSLSPQKYRSLFSQYLCI